MQKERREESSSRSKPVRPAARRFLTRAQVAEMFGVSPSTVTRWANRGLLKALRTPGGHHRFLADDVRKAIGASERLEIRRR